MAQSAQTARAQPIRRTVASDSSTKARASLADQLGSGSSSTATKNVIVLGGSYGGMHAATVLANRLPPSHRVILIERNSHFNHLYVFPRFSTLPGHEHKAFIPYTSIFKDAPKRKIRAQRDDTAKTRPPIARFQKDTWDDQQASSSSPVKQSRGGEEMLGMGSVSGRVLRSKGSTESDASSHDSRFSRLSKTNSSASRSSSVDEDSLFDDDRSARHRLQINRAGAEDLSASYTFSSASSYRSSSSDRSPRDERMSSKLSESKGALQAVSQAGIDARAEEELGRPAIQVEELTDALDKGIALEENVEEEHLGNGESDVAHEFEDSSPHVVLQASVESITPTHVVVQSVESATSSKKLWSIDSVSIPYSHLIYALGSHLPDPLRTEARSKKDGVSWMQEMQRRVEESQEIVLVGGGALGVEFATDIRSIYPTKSVTLIHSRKQLLPNFDVQVHEAALQRLNALGVKVVLGERLALTEGCPRGSTVRPEAKAKDDNADICPTTTASGEGVQARNEGVCLGNGRKLVKTTGGKEFECDMLLLCTGQQPNSGLMAQLSPTSVDGNTRLVRVMRTLQVKVPDPHGSLAQMPFDARPPCGDCDCFLDKKAAGGAHDTENTILNGGIPGQDTCLPNIYAIGDVADAFGALNAGYQAWAMADVATENILRDIEAEAKSDDDAEANVVALQPFEPAANMLKLSLGMGKMVFQGGPDEKTGKPLVEVREDAEDLHVEGVWTFMAGMSTDDMYA